MLRIYLTGEICMESGGLLVREQRLPRRQGRLAFAYLVSERHRAVSRDELTELLWPDCPPAAWEGALSALVSKLRSVLVEVGLDRQAIASAFGCYQFKLPAGAWVDTEAAMASVHEAEGALRAGTPERAYVPTVIAAAILRRPFLPGAEGAWIDSQRDTLRAALVRTLDCRAELHSWNGEPSLALRAAEEAVRSSPTGRQATSGCCASTLAWVTRPRRCASSSAAGGCSPRSWARAPPPTPRRLSRRSEPDSELEESMQRIEGADKVAGSLVFTEDMALAGLAHARLIRM